MRVTARDRQLVRDICLSHVLSRDQVLALGYFNSVTRANTRLRGLRDLRYVRVLETPFHSQFLYTSGPLAKTVVNERVAALLNGRRGSPSFLQHALAVVEVRAYLQRNGCKAWLFEQQMWTEFRDKGIRFEVRPDGVAKMEKFLVAVEVDMGHVSFDSFEQKLHAYRAFIASGASKEHWGKDEVRLLTVTTTEDRARALQKLTKNHGQFEHRVVTFESLGLKTIGGWR